MCATAVHGHRHAAAGAETVSRRSGSTRITYKFISVSVHRRVPVNYFYNIMKPLR